MKALFLAQNFAPTVAMTNPFWSADHGIATWFHERLTPVFVSVLRAETGVRQ
jgi:hypothetical protein